MDALLDVEIAVARTPLPIDELTPAERAALDALPTRERRREWLTGRNALRSLLGRLGLGRDTAAIEFPHRWLSLTHSAGVAIAAGLVAPALRGVGVDLESRPSLRPATARFFLDPTERAAAETADLVRLWTVKEAAFKANKENAGTRLLDYRISDVGAAAGTVVGPPSCPPIHYLSTATAAGVVTIAVATC